MPWYCLFCYVKSIISTSRGLFKFSSKSSKQYTLDYCSLFFYSQCRYDDLPKLFSYILLCYRTSKGYIMCYFSFAYDDILIFGMFYIKMSRNFFSRIYWIYAFVVISNTILKKSKNPIDFYFNQEQHLQTHN